MFLCEGPLALLRPSSANAMRAYPVWPLVNSPRNDGPEFLELATA
jgi:putative SOS response-associated peptidase YedK